MTPNQTDTGAVPGVCDQTSGEAKPLIEKLRARAVQRRLHDVNMVGEANVGPIQGFFDWQVAAELERLSAAAQPDLLGRETVREALEEIVSWKHDTLGPRPAPADYDQKATENFDRGARMAFYRCADRAARALTALQPSKE